MDCCAHAHLVALDAATAVVQLVNFLGVLGNFNQTVGLLPAALAVPGFARQKIVLLVFFDTIPSCPSKNRHSGDFLNGGSWQRLRLLYTDCGRALVALFDFEGDGIALFEVREGDAFELGGAEEYVFFDAFLADKATLLVSEDLFDCSLHN